MRVLANELTQSSVQRYKGEGATLACGAVGDEDGVARRAASRSSFQKHVLHRGVDDPSERVVSPGGAGRGDRQHGDRQLEDSSSCTPVRWRRGSGLVRK